MNTTADGSLYLSLRDYFAWDRGLRSHALLTEASWAQVYAPVMLKSGKTYPYGFGWFVDESNGRPWYHHSGSSQGFRTYISRYLADDLTIVVLSNLLDAEPSRFVDGIAAIIDPKLAKLRPVMPILDQDPNATRRIGAWLAAIADGKLAAEELLYTGQSALAQLKAFADLLRPLGALSRLELLERRDLGDERAVTVNAVYRGSTLRVYVIVTPAGKISYIEIQPE